MRTLLIILGVAALLLISCICFKRKAKKPYYCYIRKGWCENNVQCQNCQNERE